MFHTSASTEAGYISGFLIGLILGVIFGVAMATLKARPPKQKWTPVDWSEALMSVGDARCGGCNVPLPMHAQAPGEVVVCDDCASYGPPKITRSTQVN